MEICDINKTALTLAATTGISRHKSTDDILCEAEKFANFIFPMNDSSEEDCSIRSDSKNDVLRVEICDGYLHLTCGKYDFGLSYEEVENKTWDEAVAWTKTLSPQHTLLSIEQIVDVIIPQLEQINDILSDFKKKTIDGVYWTSKEFGIYGKDGNYSANRAWGYYTGGNLSYINKDYQLRARATLAF